MFIFLLKNASFSMLEKVFLPSSLSAPVPDTGQLSDSCVRGPLLGQEMGL